jgi:HCOMODA/2-hydroxy-3-carboxy-muconic semialdehyde decarboxylase
MPETAPAAYTSLAQRLRMAGRALARANLVHAYGHASARLDAGSFLATPAKPLGLIARGESPVRCPTSGALPPEALPEILIHQQIYSRRGEIGGVVRFQSPHLMSLSTLGCTPRARHGFGAYFAPCPPLYANPRLVRDAASAVALVDQLGTARAIVMRGNGAVTVGATLEEALTMAWYLEDAARVELEVLATQQEGQELTPVEVRDRAVTAGRLIERMWDYLTAGDPEPP